jgi:hypothetical protein
MTLNRVFVTLAVVFSASVASAQDAPRADHHQHLFSPALAGAHLRASAGAADCADRRR